MKKRVIKDARFNRTNSKVKEADKRALKRMKKEIDKTGIFLSIKTVSAILVSFSC